MGAPGVEHIADSLGKSTKSSPGGAESGAVSAAGGNATQESMNEFLKLWPNVPLAVRASILSLMKATAGTP